MILKDWLRKNSRTGLLVVTGLWMLFIFMMSAAPADQSSDMSMSVGYAVGTLVVEEFESLPEQEQQLFAESIDFPVRKTAHFLEYTLLGVLFFIDISVFAALPLPAGLFVPWLMGILYAATDEFHQLFVDGRSGQLTDVLIDGSGVLLGCVLALLVRRLYCRKKVFPKAWRGRAYAGNDAGSKNVRN